MASITSRVAYAAAIALLLQTWIPSVPYAPRAAAEPQLSRPGLPALTTAQARQLSAPATDHVIVVLRDQHPAATSANTNAATGTPASRAALLQELGQVGARAVHPYQVINAVSATISPAEATRLRGDPSVLDVVPDRVIHLLRPAPAQDLSGPAVGRGSAAAGAAGPVAPACTTTTTPSLEPEALQLTDTANADARVPQARLLRSGTGALITGSGVKVAYIAEGIDIHNPDFIRNGKSVFVDYKDFSGDGPTAPTTGGEAFLDASSIAAQGRHVYDVNDYLVNPLPKKCLIRILGMAPGVDLVGIKVFGQTNATTTSAFVQAIDYAVSVDEVDVLNESFGGNPFPDLSNDPISIANSNAVAAGVTVTVSSGDAGTASTIGSPASDPGVISVGASTQFRAYTQAGADGITLGNGTYTDNNIASFSSGGFTQIGPRTVDVVAPGDAGWALCTPSHTTPLTYSDCVATDRTTPSSIEFTGGTSESAPLTAGEAALIIQAYRSTHHNASPTPALVKQIITSTATDLGLPAAEQGAGLINSYRAVQAALSYRDEVATPSPRAGRLLVGDTTAFTATDKPNTQERFSFTVSNEGGQAQRVAPKLRTLGQTVFQSSYTLHLDPLSDPHLFVDQSSAEGAFIEQDFKVPAGVQYLNAAIAWLALQQPSSIVRLDLFDPAGRFTAYSRPQAQSDLSNGFGQVSVRNPPAGVWTAIIWTRANTNTGSYFGTVRLAIHGSRFVTTGTVRPAAVTLSPGHSATFTVTTRTPTGAGNRDEEIVFPAPSGTTSLLGAIPVSVRALVPLTRAGGTFSGTLTGGNGRFGSPGQTLSYQFDVPAGLHDLDLGLRIVDPSSNLEGGLVDPAGQPIDVQTMAGAIGSSGTPSFYTSTMQFYRRDPMAGRWLFVLLINDMIGSAATSQTFHATIAFNGVRILTHGIPNSARTVLRAGKPVNAAILVANTGLTVKDYFLDPRLATSAIVPLQAPDSYSVTLPITGSQVLPPFVVPPGVNTLIITAHAPSPVAFDAAPVSGAPPFGGTGSPDIYQSSGSSVDPTSGDYVAVVTVRAPEVAPGLWQAVPEQLGPFGTAGAAPSTVDVTASAIGQPFDRQVATSTGDIWSPFADRYRPLTLPSQHEGEIELRITPSGVPGTVVHGFLYLDTFNANSESGDELAAIPYTYTIGR